MSPNTTEQTLLLPSHHDNAGLDEQEASHKDDPAFNTIRDKLKHFLMSKYAHYMVIILVGLDVAGIFTDFLISLHICKYTCGERVIGDPKRIDFWEDVSYGLGIVSLVFSSLFMIELLLSLYAFRLQYFKVPFHVIDCVAIIASFLVDVIERGQTAEAGSLIIALRFFRIFKIIEEGSAAAEEVGSGMTERIKLLEAENQELRRRLVTTDR